MALAPSFDLFSVPSISIIRRSIRACSDASIPIRAGAMISLTLDTAVRTPLPAYRELSPSRNSTASFSPVFAPREQRRRIPSRRQAQRKHARLDFLGSQGFPLRVSRIWLVVSSFSPFFGMHNAGISGGKKWRNFCDCKRHDAFGYPLDALVYARHGRELMAVQVPRM